MSDNYDSAPETQAHIDRVQELMDRAGGNLAARAHRHDRSKLQEPEKVAFDQATPNLRKHTYGTAEYFAAFEPIKAAIAHHYRFNSHHPEHWVMTTGPDGNPTHDKTLTADGTAISRMSLLDILEMLCDWKAASERHADGDLIASFAHNKERFGISDQLLQILENTAKELGLCE